MNKLVLSVFDVKAGTHLPPFMARTLGEASRLFEDAVNDAKTPLHSHPDDYILVHLANWNEETGIYEPVQRIEVTNARSVIKE